MQQTLKKFWVDSLKSANWASVDYPKEQKFGPISLFFTS